MADAHVILAGLAEQAEDERRVALTPESAAKFKALGLAVQLEKGAGKKAGFADDEYRAAGVEFSSRASLFKNADIILCVAPPPPDEAAQMKKGAALIGLLDPNRSKTLAAAAQKAGVIALALELLPRISRAQSMDALSSQANLSGYRAVLEAAALFARAMPMMMTAAGTIAAARVFVMGAGVAGLQAIATAKRLGARVSATDVRPEAREQVESLGADFVMVESEESGAGEGGYAKEVSQEYRRRQSALIAETVPQQDIIICTALIPGRPAPELVSADMVRSLKAGSIIIDMAAREGGNCALSKPGELVYENGAAIFAPLDLPSRLAHDASAFYARNLYNFVAAFCADGQPDFTADDEILAACALVHPQQKTQQKTPNKGAD